MRAFEYTFYPRDVIFGAGSVDRLGEALDRSGWRRALLCSSGSARRAGQVDRMAGMLGGRHSCGRGGTPRVRKNIL